MIDQIKTTVSNYLNVPVEVLSAGKGTREQSDARHIAMYFAKENYGNRGKIKGISLQAIGKAFNRDHSTVVYSISKVHDLMDTDKHFKAQVEEIAELLKN